MAWMSSSVWRMARDSSVFIFPPYQYICTYICMKSSVWRKARDSSVFILPRCFYMFTVQLQINWTHSHSHAFNEHSWRPSSSSQIPVSSYLCSYSWQIKLQKMYLISISHTRRRRPVEFIVTKEEEREVATPLKSLTETPRNCSRNWRRREPVEFIVTKEEGEVATPLPVTCQHNRISALFSNQPHCQWWG